MARNSPLTPLERLFPATRARCLTLRKQTRNHRSRVIVFRPGTCRKNRPDAGVVNPHGSSPESLGKPSPVHQPSAFYKMSYPLMEIRFARTGFLKERWKSTEQEGLAKFLEHSQFEGGLFAVRSAAGICSEQSACTAAPGRSSTPKINDSAHPNRSFVTNYLFCGMGTFSSCRDGPQKWEESDDHALKCCGVAA